MRITFEQMHQTVKTAFIKAGMSDARADLAARIHTESSCDGVYSHGLNRVPRYIEYIAKGLVHVDAEPELVHSSGAIEKYDGNLGSGVLNARFAMKRAMELSETQGLGMVTLKKNNHWMRDGAFGCSQVFLALSPAAAGGAEFIRKTVMETIEHFYKAERVEPHLMSGFPEKKHSA